LKKTEAEKKKSIEKDRKKWGQSKKIGGTQCSERRGSCKRKTKPQVWWVKQKTP